MMKEPEDSDFYWQYRIVKLASGEYGLFEVFFENGKPAGRTTDPVGPAEVLADSPWSIRSDILYAAKCMKLPVIEDSAIGKIAES